MNWRGAGFTLACVGLGLLTALTAGCGTQTAPVSTPRLHAATAPLSTSLVTPQGTWAVAVMGGSAASENNFWQVFVRPAGASRWSLVTPEGVADNGGLTGWLSRRLSPACSPWMTRWPGEWSRPAWPTRPRRWPHRTRTC